MSEATPPGPAESAPTPEKPAVPGEGLSDPAGAHPPVPGGEAESPEPSATLKEGASLPPTGLPPTGAGQGGSSEFVDDGLVSVPSMGLLSSPLEPDPDGGVESTMTLVEHLSELRGRILTSLALVALVACATLYHSAALVGAIVRTAPKISFIALTPTEVFFTQIKVGLLSAVLATVPLVFWQAWLFVRPGLNPSERTLVRHLLPTAVVLFAVGVGFAYGVVIPMSVKFLSEFTLESVQAAYSLEAYTSFVLFFLLGFGLVFESPILLLMLARIGLVSREGLVARRKIVILGCFVVAAILTPTPDMVTQTLMALPMWLLFEGTLVVLWFLKW